MKHIVSNNIFTTFMQKVFKCRKHKCFKRYNGDSEWICPKCQKEIYEKS